MPCERLFGTGNRVVGFVCGRSRSKKSTPQACATCGSQNASLQCDGPGPVDGKTCDAWICGGCAVQVRALNKDFCPKCLDLTTGLNVCESRQPAQCSGPFVEDHSSCLTHSLLFDYWHAHRGGDAVYGDPLLDREQRRERFRAWLRKLTPPNIAAVRARYAGDRARAKILGVQS